MVLRMSILKMIYHDQCRIQKSFSPWADFTQAIGAKLKCPESGGFGGAFSRSFLNF